MNLLVFSYFSEMEDAKRRAAIRNKATKKKETNEGPMGTVLLLLYIYIYIFFFFSFLNNNSNSIPSSGYAHDEGFDGPVTSS